MTPTPTQADLDALTGDDPFWADHPVELHTETGEEGTVYLAVTSGPHGIWCRLGYDDQSTLDGMLSRLRELLT